MNAWNVATMGRYWVAQITFWYIDISQCTHRMCRPGNRICSSGVSVSLTIMSRCDGRRIANAILLFTWSNLLFAMSWNQSQTRRGDHVRGRGNNPAIERRIHTMASNRTSPKIVQIIIRAVIQARMLFEYCERRRRILMIHCRKSIHFTYYLRPAMMPQQIYILNIEIYNKHITFSMFRSNVA